MREIGVVTGRFQILHNDHIKYLMAARARCRYLVVAITNPDPTLTKYDEVDPHRSRPDENPLTYYERYVIVKEGLIEQGLDHHEFAVVPLPINFPELYKYYVPLNAVFFLTIYDGWGEKKLTMFNSMGLETEILWRKTMAQKGLSSTTIRHMIATGQQWEHLVPPVVSILLKQFKLIDRIKT